MTELATDTRFQWLHPKPDQHSYVLSKEGKEHGRISWPDGPEESAVGVLDGEELLLDKVGFLKPHVLVRDRESGELVARFDATAGSGGLLTLVNGRHFRWYSNQWRAEWGWMDVAEKDAIRFRRSFEVEEKREGFVEIEDLEATHDQAGLLILLGWYVIVMSSIPVIYD